MSLTPIQSTALNNLQAHYEANGQMPSLREFAGTMGMAKGSVTRVLVQLEERGFIRRLKGKQRAIEIIKTPTFTEVRARCWRWDGSERGPQIGDAVIIERRK